MLYSEVGPNIRYSALGKHHREPENVERNLEISISLLEGETLKTVATRHKLTGPRVGNIIDNVVRKCNCRYEKATGEKSKFENLYRLKEKRKVKDELIPFIKKWGASAKIEDIWKLDIPLVNKVFWNTPNERPLPDERRLIKVLVRCFPEHVYYQLNDELDKLGWQLAFTYAERLFKIE
jgi:hypothetical protein